MIDKEGIIRIDALPIYQEYSAVFLYTDVPEEARHELARKVTDRIQEKLPED